MSDALAVGLQAARSRGRRPRRRLPAEHSASACIAVLAIWKCGAVVVPCNPMLRERELGKILRSSGCLAMICQEDLYADVGRAALPATAVRHTITTSPLEFLGLRQAAADDAGRHQAQPSHRYRRHARDHRAPRRRAAARRRAHGRRRRVHGAHVGHDRRREGRDEHASQRRVRDLGVRSLDRPDGQGRHSRARAAVPRHGPHRPRHARDADGQPVGAVLPVRRQRGVPPGGAAPRDVHGLGDHGVHRAAEQRRARASTT